MSQISIRSANARDFSAITAIYNHAILNGTGTFETEIVTEVEMERRWLEVVKKSLPYLVAENMDGQLIGYGYMGSFRTRAAYRYTVEDSVYIDPEWVGQGVGQALLQGLISALEKTEVREIIAMIGDSANLGSIRLHEKLGFAHVGVLQNSGFKFGRFVDVVMMQKSLEKTVYTPSRRTSEISGLTSMSGAIQIIA